MAVVIGTAPTKRYMPGDTHHESNPLYDEPRNEFLATMDQLSKLEHEVEIFSVKLARAVETVGESDPAAVIMAANTMASNAQKDMSWKKVLASEDREQAIEALNKELSSLQKTILQEILPTDPEYASAVKTATPGRILLDIKRSGMFKARAVKQGFKEDKTTADGPDFNYYSNVVKLDAVRLAMFKRRKHGRIMGIKDVSTAFLQSNKYGGGQYKIVCFRNPLTGEWMYFKQYGPIYGEASAPVRWETTIAPWLESIGFTRGKNEPGVFYHFEKDLLILLYVDDIYAEGFDEDVNWVFYELGERFDCKDADFIVPGSTNDYLGMGVIHKDDRLHLSMESYIDNAIDILDQGELR